MHDHFAERIKWCQEIRYAATEQLRRIEQGYRSFSADGDEPLREVTDLMAEQARTDIEKMDALIAAYEARRQ